MAQHTSVVPSTPPPMYLPRRLRLKSPIPFKCTPIPKSPTIPSLSCTLCCPGRLTLVHPLTFLLRTCQAFWESQLSSSPRLSSIFRTTPTLSRMRNKFPAFVASTCMFIIITYCTASSPEFEYQTPCISTCCFYNDSFP
jgi:hypothetical protein